VGELDSAEAVLSTVSLRSVVSGSVAEPQLYTEVLGLFAGIALVLAAVGIYGVVSYSVTQQTQEIGVRMAMGATRTNILVHVLGRTMIFTVFGLILGTGGALAVTALLRSLLFEIRPHDPGTILAASLALATVSLIAAYVPARRASQINPNSALRL
jgi:ABC-type antimicrobial peptide transport system permease subunit